ncbi:TOBE domain-containing protein [Halocatena pleomorpha]|uniref:LysR family transcriptional regulator n=1 Tax=Halocatena pleomorpha TaxID=1785090 RepID=A0A3P3RJS9_9EURY|nr:TOBE domain-containing protein [Halocatena pleomorpha]RRJ33584.1 LysR family transcriptional regulator [Halocatena pleomorpha]
MDAEFETRLQAKDVSFETADARLLRAVDDQRSLNAAADALGRSFSRSHRRIKALEAVFGPLVERQRGGIDGGGSELTDNARDLLARFERLRTAYAGTAETEKTVVFGTVTQRSAELATVQTPAGTVRALVSTPADRVQVVLRADAITLHTPDAVPSTDGMSARNRLAGTISYIDRGESIARVACDVGIDAPLIALVTQRTIDEVGFRSDDPVVASFKATATRTIPMERDR